MSTPCAHRTVLAMAAACIVWAFLAFPARSGAEIPAGSEWVEPATGMVFVRVPAGCFTSGCEGSGCPDSALPAQEVCLDGFWIARHETTQAQWERVMGSNPASFRGGRRPVENVSWREAMEFGSRLTELSPAGGSFSLPRGAQWEYACSAGWSGREPGDFARLEATVPVDRLEPNAYGVCGMAGNVREWVRDPFKGAEAGEEAARTVRGDSWMKAPKNPRCTLRLGLSPGVVSNTVGFRLVRVDPP
ncbi:MAG: formylglycine-generating enzyme family protein, partial [Desulfovibrionaceae bacterium]